MNKLLTYTLISSLMISTGSIYAHAVYGVSSSDTPAADVDAEIYPSTERTVQNTRDATEEVGVPYQRSPWDNPSN